MKLAAVGSNCIDYYANIDGGKSYPGGGPVNMAVYTVRNGGSASYIGPIGDDDYGKIMYDAVKSKGVNVSHMHIKKGTTAITQVELIDEDIEFISKHDMVVCDLWGKVEGQYKDLKEKGIVTAFDCATRPEDQEAQTAMPYSDYLFFSSDEGDNEALRNQMKKYQAKGPKLVIAMLGMDGSLCFDGKDFYKYGIVKCDKVVDTMGAGDSYIAGFLAGIVDGLSIEECMHQGAATATETLKYFGAW